MWHKIESMGHPVSIEHIIYLYQAIDNNGEARAAALCISKDFDSVCPVCLLCKLQ